MKYGVLFLCLSFYVTKAVDIGSDTAVTRFNTQQIVNNGDRIAGFAALDAGFILSGPRTTGEFDSFFQVSGDVGLQFGTLTLNQDLIFHNVSRLTSNGNIEANCHIIELSPKMGCLPISDTADICSITFTANLAKTAVVFDVGWSFDSKYLASGTDKVGAFEFYVDEVIDEGLIVNRDSVAFTKGVTGVDWHPTEDFIAKSMLDGAVDELQTFTFNRVTNTLTLIDGVNLGDNAIDVAWHPDGDRLAAATEVVAGELRVYVMASDGTFGAVITEDIEDALSVDWNFDGSLLAVGTKNGGGSDDFLIYEFTKGSPDTLTLNASLDTSADVNSVSWNQTTTDIIAIGTSAGTDRVQVYRHNSSAGTLTALTNNNPVTVEVESVDWHPDGVCLAAGTVANGADSEVLIYKFADDAITEIDTVETGATVNSVQWSPNGRMLATGDATPEVAIYRFDMDFRGDTSLVTYSDIQLFLNCNVQSNGPAILFEGQSLLIGRGNIWSLSPTFSFCVAANATLLLKDMTIKGMNEGKLCMVDSTSTVSFHNVELVLEGDYTFTQGHFEILKDLKISGDGHTFVYQSPETSTIRDKSPETVTIDGECNPGFCGALILEPGITFSYDSSLSNTLLAMESDNAKIIMNSATLAATTSLQLTVGQLFVDGKSSFISTDGIMFGDGTAVNNLFVELLPAAKLDVTGPLIYNLV